MPTRHGVPCRRVELRDERVVEAPADELRELLGKEGEVEGQAVPAHRHIELDREDSHVSGGVPRMVPG